MNILHTVEQYHPSAGGMQEVVKQLSENLVKRGHSVTVATSKNSHRKELILNGVMIKEFTISGNLVRGLTGDTESYKDFLLNSHFDIITNFAAQQWATDIMLPLLPNIQAHKIFVPTGFSGLFLPEYTEYFEQMKTWMRLYDCNIFLSNNYRDINFARKNGINNYTIIPNGASAEEFDCNYTGNIRYELNFSEKQFLILLVGSHTGIKGHKEAITIFDRAKITDAVLVIVGNVFSQRCYNTCKIQELLRIIHPLSRLKKKKILIRMLSREKTIALYQAADLFLFPSNIECSPLVLYECLASKTPFLTTDVGNAKEICEWSGGGQVLPTLHLDNGYSVADVRPSAQVLEQIYNNNHMRQQMCERGYEKWKENFSWEKIAESYENLYYSTIQNNKSAFVKVFSPV